MKIRCGLKKFFRPISISVFAVILLAACSPKMDWRYVTNPEPNYTILMPSKPATAQKNIKLGDSDVEMQMQGAVSGEVQFAVAFIKAKEKQDAESLLELMKNGMLRNISASKFDSFNSEGNVVVANGKNSKNESLVLYGRFLTHHGYAIQVILIGKPENVTKEIVETYFDSLKLN